jgi:virginiamycin B lyase
MARYLSSLLCALALVTAIPAFATETSTEAKGFFYGKVTSGKLPVKGAMVTFFHGSPVHSLTVFADDEGRFLSPALPWPEGYSARIRRAGWTDVVLAELKPRRNGTWLAVEMERITDSQDMIQQLPSNYWMNLVLEEFDNKADRHEFMMQCTYCHQQGSPLTSRRQFTRAQWTATILDMGGRSAILHEELRNKLPDIYLKAYDPANVAKKLPQYDSADGPLPIPTPEARRALIEEWDLGGNKSSHHDMMVYHPDGSIWSVDGPTDTLHKISFATNPDGDRSAYAIPRGNHKPGGVYAKMSIDPNDDYLGAHSLQTAPNGDIWLTLASGNQLAGFSPGSEKWEIVDLKEGINPHTLRFDAKGRIWFTISATNHVGRFDPATKEQKFVRLPAPDWQTQLILLATPFLLEHADWFNLREQSAKSDGVSMPLPYGIDINPVDGSVWYSQLNMSSIGRIDPETLEVTPVKTPFMTPRRLRFDSRGLLWVPSYAESTLNRYNPVSKEWKSWVVPVEPLGTEVPYAVFVDKKTDHVWITGTQSDTMIRFKPETEEFTIYPLPTRVTYTRDIDIDDQNRLWSSHSSFPTWHIESGIPKVIRVDPDGAPDIDASGVFSESVIAPVSAQTVTIKATRLKK